MTAPSWIKEQAACVDSDNGGDNGCNLLFGGGCGCSFVGDILNCDDCC